MTPLPTNAQSLEPVAWDLIADQTAAPIVLLFLVAKVVVLARVPLDVAYGRALRLMCPRCGQGKLFKGLHMVENCSGCGMKYEREPGYFLGSIYFNYGWTCMSMTVAYMVLHVALEFENMYVVPPLALYAFTFPVFFHRYARAIWLAFDCNFDHHGLADVDPSSTANNEPPKDPQ